MSETIGLGDVFSVSPLIALFLASLIPITVKVLRGNRELPPLSVLIHGLGGVFASLILLFTVYFLFRDLTNPTAFMDTLVLDGLTFSVGVLSLVLGAFFVVFLYRNPATRGPQFSELMFLALNSILALLVVVSAADLIALFVGLEYMSLCLYLMIGMSHEQKVSKEAAIKYFVLGSVASGILLYGIAFLFGATGSTSIAQIVASIGNLSELNDHFLVLGMIFVILGFCFKVSIFPLHAWTPDVYQGAPTPITAYMATAIKAVSFVAFLRIIAGQFILEYPFLFNFLQWLAVITMIVGNVGALVQTSLKRVIAYSSIAHSGYLMIGVIATGISDDIIYSGSAVVFYLIAYSLMTFGVLVGIGMLERNEQEDVSISRLKGFASERPFMALCLAALLFSLAGLPPLLGFFGKVYLFAAAIREGLIWLAVWGVLNSVIAVYYYLRPIIAMYMEEKETENGTPDHRITYSPRALVLITATAILVLGILSGPFYQIVEATLLQ